MRRVSLLGCSLLGLAVSGCFGTPTPLAPKLGGSVGVPHHGVLTDAMELPVSGEGYKRLRPKSTKYWGTEDLVRAIRTASANVARQLPGAPPVLVGDLSARFGGKIPRHRSHRTGRDVDFLWYVKSPSGAPLPSPGFVRVDTDGLAPVFGTGSFVQLDVERQWLLFKELLTSEHVSIQFMFLSRGVEALLIDYARAKGEDPELVWHAETVMLQPGDSAAHDDHVHVRVACSPEEAVAGCEGGGPYWQWLPPELTLAPLDGGTIEQLAREDPLPVFFEQSSEEQEPTTDDDA